MITETKNEHKVDGDGRPVVELKGSRQFHVNTPPSGELEVEPWKLQVWSTVIGASLTTVMPSGDKLFSNVYAGGAVIAVENEGIASMKTADPVTGTVANYVYFESEFSSSTEEQEPLGQNIYPFDPEDPPEPLPSDSNVGSADWPEWQCHAGTGKVGSFDAMPFHCQHKAMLAAGSALPWENEKDSNPRKIPEKTPQKTGPPKLIKRDKRRTKEEIAAAKAIVATQKIGKDNESIITENPANAGESVVNDPYSAIMFFSKVSFELDTRAIVDSTVLVTGKGGEVESPATIQAIKNQIRRIVSDSECRKAFIDGGFGDPREALLDSVHNKLSGDPNSFVYSIVSAFALRDDGVARDLGVPENLRQTLINRSAPASTDAGLGLTVVRNNIYSDGGLAYNITHEFFHAIGTPGYYRFYGLEGLAGVHDLSYLGEKYDRIMKACTK